MKDIWRKYIEKLLNVEIDWDGDVDYPEVMGPCCHVATFPKKRLQQLLKYKNWKSSWSKKTVSQIIACVQGEW